MATILSSQVIDAFLQTHSQWSYDNNHLTASFDFETFNLAVVFVTRVADIARELNHHPDMLLSFKKVTITTTTHSEHGITQLDLDTIIHIDNL